MYDFPASPSENDEYTPPVGGQTYVYKAPRWLVKGIPPAGDGGGSTGIGEAPEDTKQYGRQDAAWTEVVANPTWATLSGKPATFPPTVPIAQADVTNLTADLAGKVNDTGDTMTGDLTIAKAAPSFSLEKTAGQPSTIFFKTGTSARWGIDTLNSAESGSNVGSEFRINRYTDAGAYVDAPISINRSTGAMTLRGNVALPAGWLQLTGTPLIYFDKASGAVTSAVNFRTGTSARFSIQNVDAESTGNAGANFKIARYNDAGALIDNPLVITRSTGVVAMPNGATLAGGVAAATTTDLGLKEDKNMKGAVSGYAPLDASQKVPAINLPAYVDDVVEYANLAAFPGTGTIGIIYVALDTNKVYRWSGSAYTEISPSPGSSDAVPEGTTNKYYTDARAALKADLASPTFTGDPKSVTPTAGDNDTSIATTAFVTTAVAVAKVTVSDTAPGSPASGSLWWESDTGLLFISYNDGNTTQWVQIAATNSL